MPIKLSAIEAAGEKILRRNMKILKLFQINDCDTWADYNLENAVKNYTKYCIEQYGGSGPDEFYTRDARPYRLKEYFTRTIKLEEPRLKFLYILPDFIELLFWRNPGFFGSTEY
jgi:hypothetical protein